MKHILIILAISVTAFAGSDQLLKSGLIHPDIIQQIKPELQLTADQESKMSAIISEARSQGEPVEKTAKEQQQALQTMLRQPETTADAASAQLAKVLESEATVKQLQLRTLITLRDVLTPEQQRKAQTLSVPKVAAKSELEAQVMAKASKLRAVVDSLGEKPTEAMTQRGAEIEDLMKSGDLKAAEAALDKLIADTGLNEPEEKSEAPDFSKYEPGNTDLETLKQRLEDVKADAQSVISIPLMRQFLKAKEALETAKAAEDVAAIGRILTWAEGVLAESK